MTKLWSMVGAGQKTPSRDIAAREALRVARPIRSAIPFLAVSLTIALLLVLVGLYTPCYRLTVGAVEVGYVSGREMVANTVNQVEGQISQILGRDYALDVDFDYNFAVAPKDEMISYTALSEELYQMSPAIKQAYVLSVDGMELGAAPSKAVLDGVLADLQAQYTTEHTREVFFANEARVTRKYIPTEDQFVSGAAFLGAATEPVIQETAHEVQPGETVAAIAQSYQMSQDGILAANAKLADGAALIPGQMVAVEKTLPRLSVGTVDRITYTRAIESPVREVEDPDMYEGDSKILTQGLAGSEQVVADVTALNGERMNETILSQNTITEATETVKAVGTKERPKYYSTGSLQWPAQGRLTSPFGYRYIFGASSFHNGIDIANAYGTPLYAADSGIVTFADYQGTYGNMIKVDHGNGMETVYAHCATMGVSVGDGVVKGQQVGTMGATGRATGKHCHFEVRVGGEKVNPQLYLP